MAKGDKEKGEANGSSKKGSENDQNKEKEKVIEPKKVAAGKTTSTAHGSNKASTSSAAAGGKQSAKQSQVLSELAKSMSELAAEVKSIKAAQQSYPLAPVGPSNEYFGENYFPPGPAYSYGYGDEVAEGYDYDPSEVNYDQSKQQQQGSDPSSTDGPVVNVNVSEKDKEEGELDVDVVDDKYDKFLAEFMTPKEETSAPVAPRLADGINAMFRNGMDSDMFRKKVSAIKCPSNMMEELCDVQTDSLVYALLKHHTKKFDERLKIIQTAITKAGCCMTQMVDSIQNTVNAGDGEERCAKADEWTSLGMTGLALLGHGFHNLCLRRRELQKPDLASRFENIFEADVTHNNYLYGGNENIEKMVKEKSSSAKLYRPFEQQSNQPPRGRGYARRGYYPQNQYSRGGGPMRRGRGFYARGAAPYPQPRGTMFTRRGRGSVVSTGRSKGASATPKGEPTRASIAESEGREIREDIDNCPMLAYATMVSSVPRDAIRQPSGSAPAGQTIDIRVRPERTAPTKEETNSDSRTYIRKAYRDSELSEQATEILLCAWKPGTHKQYSVYIRKWNKFCMQREINNVKPSVNVVIEFLTCLYHEGLGYSALNTARSALSQFIVWKGHCTIGSHPWVIKFLRAVYNLRPPVPRYSETWDVSVLLRFLRTLTPVKKLSLKFLTLKTVTLMALLIAARAQTVSLLDLKNMTKHKSKFCFTVGASDLKQSRQGYKPPLFEFKAYPVDRALCIFTILSEYIDRTSTLRDTETQLFVSYMKPHKRVTSSTISNWVKTAMAKAGLDITVYKPHSVRAASASKALKVGGCLEQILKTAGWSGTKTFAKYYNKNIITTKTLGESVLTS